MNAQSNGQELAIETATRNATMSVNIHTSKRIPSAAATIMEILDNGLLIDLKSAGWLWTCNEV